MTKDYWIILTEKQTVEDVASLLMPEDSEIGSYYEVELYAFFGSEREASEALAKQIERQKEHYDRVRLPDSKYHPDNLRSSSNMLEEAKKCRIRKVTMTLSFEAD